MRITTTQIIAPRRSLGTFCMLSALAAIAVSTAAAQSCDEWRLVAPETLQGHKMVYDSARGVTVIFGGYELSSLSRKTWEWNGASWSLAATTGPEGRIGMGMAFDSARGVTVLFGGNAGGGYMGDTWEWNGATWTQRQIAGPSPRSGVAMTYDAARGVCVLYGGYDPTIQGSRGQTWEYDGSAWVQRSNSGPPPLQQCEMAYDSARAVSVLFGGWNQANSNILRQTWEWNGTTWTQRGIGGTSPDIRSGHGLTFDASIGRTVLFGGGHTLGSTASDETWEWDGTTWVLAGTAGPSARVGSPIAYDSARNAIVLYSGEVGLPPRVRDTWERVSGVWTLRKDSAIEARYGHAMTYDSNRNVTVMFGGRASNTLLGDTVEWDGNDWIVKSTSGPSPRYYHEMVYDSARGVTVLFGGVVNYSTFALSGETWEWDGNSWSLRSVTGPGARYWYGLAYDSARGVTVLFGGNDGARDNETWEWNGTAWTQRIVASPSARYRHAMTYDSDRSRVVMFGGWDGAAEQDTWEYNGTAWTRVATTGPAARENHAMAYDSSAEVVVLTGGDVPSEGSGAGETWEWDGLSWVNRTIVAQNTDLQRRHHSMSFDSGRGTMVMFGGSDPYDSADTWERTNGAPVVSIVGPASVGAGLDVVLTADACGSRMTYQWRKEGSPLSDGATGSGSILLGTTTPTLTIANVQFADAGDYEAVVTNLIDSTTSELHTLAVRTPIPGDLNDDGDVDLSDLATLLANFGCGFPTEACVGDIDGDFDTDLSDLATLLAFFVVFAH